jgi:tetratricopeptide (TPR) repeat protein
MIFVRGGSWLFETKTATALFVVLIFFISAATVTSPWTLGQLVDAFPPGGLRTLLESQGNTLFTIFLYGGMITLGAVVFEKTIGFRLGFIPEVREYWRRVPHFLGGAVIGLGILTIIANLDKLFQSAMAEQYQQLGLDQFNNMLGASSLIYASFFLLAFLLSLVVGYQRTPHWRLSQLQAQATEQTMIGMGSKLDPSRRKLLRKAEHFLEKGQALKAAKVFEKLGGDFFYRAGKLYREKGLTEKANEVLVKAGEHYARVQNFIRAGNAYFFAERWDKAVQAYGLFKPNRAFMKDEARMKDFVTHYGQALMALERYREAGQLFEQNDMFRYAAEAFEKAGLATQASHAYKQAGEFESSFRALKDAGQEEEATLERAKYLAGKGEFAQAGLLFEKAQQPLAAAEAFSRAGHPEKAAPCFEKSKEWRKAAEAYLEAGRNEDALRCYELKGDYQKAAQLAQHLGLQEKVAEFLFKAKSFLPAAHSYLLLGETTRAVDAMRNLHLQDGNEVEVCLRELRILVGQDRVRDALACAYGVLENREILNVHAPIFAFLAECHTRAGRFKKAAQYAIKAAQLAPGEGEYLKVARSLAKRTGISFSLTSSQTTAKDVSVRSQNQTLKASRAGGATVQHPEAGVATLAAPPPRKPPANTDPEGDLDVTATLDDFSVFDLTQEGPLGRYRIVKEIGRGGMGMVYKAVDRKLNRPIALKMLHPEYNNQPKVLLFFKREAQAIAALNHPNIVGLYDAGMERGCFYMIMEYVEGYTLDKLQKKYPDVLNKSLVWVWFQVAQGLKYAHDQGIVHRDLKPSNIMVTKSRGVKILDFGLAKQLEDTDQTKQLWGTPAFMAPELFHGERASLRSDIYSLGSTLYMLSTGEPPNYGENPAKKFVGDGLPVPPNQLNPKLSERFSNLVQRCLLLNPAERPQDGGELMREIKKIGKT